MSARFILSLAVVTAAVTSFAAFDIGGLTKGLDSVKKGVDTAKDASKVAKIAGIGPKEERSIGDSTAMEVISRYGGLVRDDDIMRRINLVPAVRRSRRNDADRRPHVLHRADLHGRGVGAE